MCESMGIYIVCVCECECECEWVCVCMSMHVNGAGMRDKVMVRAGVRDKVMVRCIQSYLFEKQRRLAYDHVMVRDGGRRPSAGGRGRLGEPVLKTH